MNYRTLALLCAVTLAAAGSFAQPFYVDLDVGDDGNAGTDWGSGNAFASIQAGIDAAYNYSQANGGISVEVWVAEGTYYNNARLEGWGFYQTFRSLVLKQGVHVYGGFKGDEDNLSDRKAQHYATIVGTDSGGGNVAYHTVAVGSQTGSPLQDDVILDGFIITGGRAGVTPNAPLTDGNLLDGNDGYHTARGGGLFIWGATPSIRNCTFYDNRAYAAGGAIAIERINGTATGNATIYNCLFYDNGVTGTNPDPSVVPNWLGAGAIFIDKAAPEITNCTITNNDGGNGVGGGVFYFDSSAAITNTIIWGNSAAGGSNEINGYIPFMSGNSLTVTYSDTENPASPGTAYPGTGNFWANPLFRNPGAADYRLFYDGSGGNPDSPCLNTGNPTAPVFTEDIRLAGRVFGGRVDVGAYEYKADPIAEFDVDPSEGGAAVNQLAGDPIQFVNLSNTFGTWTETAYNWTFQDTPSNGSSTDLNPGYTWSAPGYYDVTLQVSTAETPSGGNVHIETKSQFAVIHALPTAAFTADSTSGPAPFTVTFDGSPSVGDSGSLDLIDQADIDSWTWEIYDESDTLIDTITGSAPDLIETDYTFSDVGFYEIRLEVTTIWGSNELVRDDYILAEPPALEVVTQPVDETIITGDSFTKTITANGGWDDTYGGGYTYQWYIDLNENGLLDSGEELANGTYTRTVPGSGTPPDTTPPATQPSTDVDTVIGTVDGATDSTLTITRALYDYEAQGTENINPSGFQEKTSQYRCEVTDSNPFGADNVVNSDAGLLTIVNRLNILEQPQDGTVYLGSAYDFEVVAIGGTGEYNYIWYRVPAAGLPDGNGQNAPQFHAINLGTTHNGDYQCYLDEKAASVPGGVTPSNITSDLATLTVVPAVTVSTDATMHENTGNTLTITSTTEDGIPPYSYSWEWEPAGGGGYQPLTDGAAHPSGSGNIVTYSGANGETLEVPTVQLVDAGSYRVTVQDSGPGAGTNDNSTTTVTVTDLLDAGATVLDSTTPDHSGAQGLYVGEDFQLSVSPTGGTTPYSYQWQISDGAGGWINIPAGDGGTANPLVVTNVQLADAGDYRCLVDDSSPDPEVGSTPLAMDVYEDISLTQQPVGATRNVTESYDFTTGSTGGWGAVTYQWYFDDGLGGGPVALPDTFTNVSGADTEELTVGPIELTNEGDYYCEVSDSAPTPQVVATDTVTLTVTNFLAVTPIPDINAYTGENVVLNVTVAGGTTPYSYEWWQDDDIDGGYDSQGTTAVGTFDLGAVGPEDAGSWYVTVSDSDAGNPDVDSGAGLVDVRDLPTITDQPDDATQYAGQDITLQVAVADGFPPYTYVWRENGTAIPGAPDDPVFTFTADMAQDGSNIDVQVSDQGSDIGGVTTVTSDPALIDVVETALTFDEQPAAETYAYTDDSVFSLQVQVSGGLPPYDYEWKRVPVAGGAEETVGTNTPSLAIDPSLPANAPNSWDYRVDVTDQVTTTPSDDAFVQIADHLAFVQELDPATAGIEGDDVTLDVQVSGGLGNISYQWYKDVAKALEVIPGANANSLLLEELAEEDEGLYQVNVNDEGSTVSGTSDEVISSTTLEVSAGVPAAGGFGLAALAALTALGGAMAIRRRRD